MATFHERFNILYDESDKSQEEFGHMFNASKSQIFNWRSGRGEPDSETIKLIAKACKVSVDWLVGNSNDRRPYETIAAHRIDNPTDDLPPEAIRSIEEFKELMRLKYKRNKT